MTPSMQCGLLAMAAGILLSPQTTCLAQERKERDKVVQKDAKPANRLARETSPYLLQHAHNPVDWYPWGEEAFEKAVREDKPIFLSIGYAACHWCHVMERESFEDEGIANYLREHFVAIKVDREERPDVDEIYMRAVQAMQQHGGWPLSVWLTPEGKPFAGGTYFPKPNFLRVLQSIQSHWRNNRAGVDGNAEKITEWLGRSNDATDPSPWPENLEEGARAMLLRSYDEVWGGFYGPPKFPHTNDLRLLLRHHLATGDEKSLAMADHTLRMMWRGGMYDHLAGGFHRYSVDEKWLVPHFEKMLYDNALLACTYTEAWLLTRDDRFARITREILDYVEREMTSEKGGFYSTTDADSEGEEGKFFVWTKKELAEVLGPERAARFAKIYGVSDVGNFEHGNSILHLPETLEDRARELSLSVPDLERELEADRRKLYERRQERVKPLLDDKILADWNGLMITAFVKAARALPEPRYLDVARRATDFAFRTFRTEDGRLLHSHRAGITKIDGMLADHAYLLEAVTELFLATGDTRELERALWLAERLQKEFLDREEGSFFHTAESGEALIARFKDSTDGATPNPAAIATRAFATLFHVTGRTSFREVANDALRSAASLATRAPNAHASFLLASQLLESDVTTCVLTRGEGFEELRTEIWSRLRPKTLVVELKEDVSEELSELAPLLAGKKKTEDGRAQAYVCRDFTCKRPTSERDSLAHELSSDT